MPNSQRNSGVMPRLPVPSAQSRGLQFSDEMIAQLTAIWQAELALLRMELRPWYVRVWEWVRGR